MEAISRRQDAKACYGESCCYGALDIQSMVTDKVNFSSQGSLIVNLNIIDRYLSLQSSISVLCLLYGVLLKC